MSKYELRRVQTRESLINEITTRQIRSLGYTVRKSQLEAVALTGKINGTQANGTAKESISGLDKNNV